jgi:hypothetical protein
MLLPQSTAPLMRRQGALWVTPPFVQKLQTKTNGEEHPTGFLLHSFCEVIQRGRSWNAEVTSQEIRLVTVSHIDPSAECTHAMLYYSLDNLAHVNCVPMVARGLSTRSFQGGALPAESIRDKDRKAHMMRAKRFLQLPLPHIFHGRLWGPVGARALYSVYLRRDGAYNPFSERGFWLLRNGNLWEVTF